MKKEYRLLSNEDFTHVIHNGKTNKSNGFVVYALKNNLVHARVGISVSKKRGIAVLRNRYKRQVRAMCDDSINFQNTSFDIVIIVKEGFKERTYQENHQDLKTLFLRLI